MAYHYLGSDQLPLPAITCSRPLSFAWWLLTHVSCAVRVNMDGDVTSGASDDDHAQSLQAVVCDLVKRTCKLVSHSRSLFPPPFVPFMTSRVPASATTGRGTQVPTKMSSSTSASHSNDAPNSCFTLERLQTENRKCTLPFLSLKTYKIYF